MGDVWTVMNMKGGVGKTTVTAHIAGILARSYFEDPVSILVVDYDAQFNLSQMYIPPKTYFKLEKERKTTLSILIDDDVDLDPYHIQVSGNHNPPKVSDIVHRLHSSYDGSTLDIVPSTLDLMYVALGQSDKKTQPMEERFDKFIAKCREVYDLVIIDCHPAGSLFTRTSLKNSDHVIIPVVASSSFSVRGIALMFKFIAAKRLGGKEPKPHILFNRTPRSGPYAQETQIRSGSEFGPFCIPTSLKQYSAFSVPEGGSGFVWHSGAPYSSEARRNLRAVVGDLVKATGF